MRLIIHTSLTDAEIGGVIELSDAEIDRRIGAQDAADKVVKRLSMLLTARTIKLRQPQSSAAGEYSESSGNLLEALRGEIDRITRLYSRSTIATSPYTVIDEEERYRVEG